MAYAFIASRFLAKRQRAMICVVQTNFIFSVLQAIEIWRSAFSVPNVVEPFLDRILLSIFVGTLQNNVPNGL
jgi:hypothetical protein